MKTTSLRLQEETYDALNEYVENSDETQSEFVRRSVVEHLEGVVPQDEYDDLLAEHERLQGVHGQLEEDRDRLQQANEQLLTEIEEKSQAVEAAEDRHEQVMEEYERLQEEHENIQAEYEREIDHLQTQVERLQKQNTLILEQREDTKALVNQHRELAVFAEERRKVVSGEKPKPNILTRGKRLIFGYTPEGVEVESLQE